MEHIGNLEGVEKVIADQCQYGALSSTGLPVKKPTGFLTNAELLAEELQARCGGKNGICSKGLRHQMCEGKHAKAAAIYPDELCKAMLKGIANQLKRDKLLHADEFGMRCPSNHFEEIHASIGEPTKCATGNMGP